MAKLCIDDLELSGKRLLIRVDFNVPIDEQGTITDDTRVRAALPTINYAIRHGAKVLLISHLGRPKGDPTRSSASDRLPGDWLHCWGVRSRWRRIA